MTSNLPRCLFFAQKPVNINVSGPAAPILALVPASRYNYVVKSSYLNVCAKFFLDLKEVQMWTHVLKLKMVPLFAKNQ